MTINDPGHRARSDPQPIPRNWLAGVRGNPLARRADRQQAGLRRLCAVIWILALPVAFILGPLISSAGVQAASVQAHDRTPATAELLADAPKASLTSTGAAVTVSAPVTAGAAIGMGLGVGGGSWLVVGVLLMVIFRLRVKALGRRRRRDLESEWQQVAPLWLRQE